MNNFDWTQHAKGCGCEECSAFGKVLVKMLGHLATGEDQEGPASCLSLHVLADGES